MILVKTVIIPSHKIYQFVFLTAMEEVKITQIYVQKHVSCNRVLRYKTLLNSYWTYTVARFRPTFNKKGDGTFRSCAVQVVGEQRNGTIYLQWAT